MTGFWNPDVDVDAEHISKGARKGLDRRHCCRPWWRDGHDADGEDVLFLDVEAEEESIGGLLDQHSSQPWMCLSCGQNDPKRLAAVLYGS